MHFGGFHAKIDLAAGGWYRMEVRAIAGVKTVAKASVERIGAGEIFVVAGQSNSANHGARSR